jgi:hypothetical protein
MGEGMAMAYKHRLFHFILTCFCVASWGGCTKTEPRDPIVQDDAFRNLDPDQKALPKDEPPDVATKPVTDTTLDGDGATLAPGAETAPAAPQAPETPKFEPTSETKGTGSSSEIRHPIGSGPQKRYIKASELNIRSQPNRFSKVVGTLVGGDEVRVTIHGGWAKLGDGQWIRSRWLVKNYPKQIVGIADDNDDKVTKPKPQKKSSGTKRAKPKKSRK